MSGESTWLIFLAIGWAASCWYAYSLGRLRGTTDGLREANESWRSAHEICGLVCKDAHSAADPG